MAASSDAPGSSLPIALDAMGGDHAPGVAVEGAVSAAVDLGARILLVGRPDEVEPLLRRHNAPRGIVVVEAPDVIAMDDHPAQAVRRKRDSSIVVGTRLVRDGQAAAFVSAGNTGALMAAALFELKRIRGVDRPALAAILPTLRGKTLLIDVGANADCRPEHLAQFALMGSIYVQRVFGVVNPSVGLLSIGEEASKGNALVQQAYSLLAELPISFAGNVEGKDIPAGCADVVVCDGFVGNVVLKLSEGVATSLTEMIRQEIRRSWISRAAALGVLPALRRVRRRLDYAEYGGAPLLGVHGLSVAAHGRSNALAIKSAVRVAMRSMERDVVGHISRAMAESSQQAAPPPPPATTS